MATSGIYTIQYTRDDIIKAALRKLSTLAEGQTPTTEDYTNATVALNMLMQSWRGLGQQLWLRNTYTMSLTNGVQSYNIGTGYTINTPYPLHINQAVRTETNVRINMEIVPDYNFNQLPANSSGSPIQLSYTPYNNYGVIKLWPTPDSYAASNITIQLTYQRPQQIFTSSTDTMDFPEEWYTALVYNLAVQLAPEWGIPLPDREILAKEARDYLAQVLANGDEDTSIFLQPDLRR